MKICIVCGRLCYGGAERVAVMWANGFHHRGHDVMVVTNLNDPITYSLDGGIKVRQLTGPNGNKLKKWAYSVPNLRRYIKEFTPDVVIGVLSTCSLVAWMATRGLGIPVIATEHDSFERPQSAPMSRWERFTKFIINRLYRQVTVLTEADYRVIGKRLSNVTVMPNPLALSPIDTIPQKQRVILAAGRVDVWHYKGFDVLMRSLASSVTFGNMDSQSDTLASLMRRGGWRLQIAGVWREDSSKEYLLGIAREHGVDDLVEFLGFVDDMQSLYQRSSVFVLSSRYEGFGLVLIEAMSQGCAPVACDYKGRQREIINPSSVLPKGKEEHSAAVSEFCVCDNGILCPPDDVEALAVAMAKMIVDDEYREFVRNNAVERSKYYTVASISRNWEKLIESTIGKHAF